MVMFNSYVKLPEGMIIFVFDHSSILGFYPTT